MSSGNRRFRWVPKSFAVPSSGSVSAFRISGFGRLRARGFEGFGVRCPGNRVPGTRGIKKVLGCRDSVHQVPKVALYFETFVL